MQEGRCSGPHNGSSHVLAVDSSASVVLAAEREEVHIVVENLFFLNFPLMDRQWLRRGRKGEGREREMFIFVSLSPSLSLHQSKITICVSTC